ncbi:MarR family winged helix-turn-helix transcriptional regulator [Acidisoma sp. 7E03]
MLILREGFSSTGDRVAKSRISGESPCSCTALRKATRRISQLYDHILAPTGLRTTQRAILAEIGRSQPVTTGRLAAALIMDSGGLTHTLKPLEREGYIAIAVDPLDRRNRLIRLTPTGQSKLRESEALWAEAQTAFEAALGADRSRTFRDVTQFLTSDALFDGIASAEAGPTLATQERGAGRKRS